MIKKAWFAPSVELLDCAENDMIRTSVGVIEQLDFVNNDSPAVFWKDLIKDLNFTGFIFENMCMRDLKIHADASEARLSYYRDKNDFEVDCILETADGKWGAIEIKLGAGEIPEAVENFTKFKEKVDTDKYGNPSFLMVLTGADYSYVRDDGIYVVSIGNLKD